MGIYSESFSHSGLRSRLGLTSCLLPDEKSLSTSYPLGRIGARKRKAGSSLGLGLAADPFEKAQHASRHAFPAEIQRAFMPALDERLDENWR